MNQSNRHPVKPNPHAADGQDAQKGVSSYDQAGTGRTGATARQGRT